MRAGLHLRARRGTAAAELALCLPVLLMVATGVADITRAVQAHSALDQAATAGARRAMDGSLSDDVIKTTITATAAPYAPGVTISRAGDSVVVKLTYSLTSFVPGGKYIWNGPITVTSSAVALVVSH